jgi:hypothetical protein
VLLFNLLFIVWAAAGMTALAVAVPLQQASTATQLTRSDVTNSPHPHVEGAAGPPNVAATLMRANAVELVAGKESSRASSRRAGVGGSAVLAEVNHSGPLELAAIPEPQTGYQTPEYADSEAYADQPETSGNGCCLPGYKRHTELDWLKDHQNREGYWSPE